MTPYRFMSIAEISEWIRDQKVSPVELVNDCLDRIERLNPTLNAFITVLADEARDAAAQAEQAIKNGQWKGPLHGVPVAVKDMFDTAGIRTTAAFEHFANRLPAKDAEIVTTLKAAGAIIVGKTNQHELAAGTTSVISYFGTVHNPWNLEYMAGGSSGGSAAAVAAGLCYATVDTDAIGSCRLPAACCGVVGFKATYGLLSNTGILEGEEADDFIIKMSHTAFMCRTVEDAALLLTVLARPHAGEGVSPPEYLPPFGENHPRPGIVSNFQATDAVRTAFWKAVDTFGALGLATTPVEAPSPTFDMPNIAQEREEISAALFKEVDVLILPTTTEAVLTIEEAKAREASKGNNDVAFSPANTIFANYYGLPAITIPCGFNESGLPLGLQIVGPRRGEGVMLAVARRFQQATDWHLSHPGQG